MGSSDPKMVISPIEQTQGQILKDREAFYQSTTRPALLDFYEQTQNFEFNQDFMAPSTSQLAAQNVGNLNQAYGAQSDQLQQSLAQRGMTGSGVEAGSMAMLGNAQAQAVGGAVNQAQLQSMMNTNNIINQQNQLASQTQNVRGSGLQALMGQAPTPTTGMGTSYMDQGSGMGDWAKAGMGLAGAALGGPMGGMIGSSLGDMFSGGGGGGEPAGGFNFGAGTPNLPALGG